MHETCDGISIWGWNKIENIKFAKIKVQRVYMYRLYRNSLSKEHRTWIMHRRNYMIVTLMAVLMYERIKFCVFIIYIKLW